MKRLIFLFINCLLALIPSVALAHGCAEELGHHWASHEYIYEIHYQFAIMAVLTIIIFAFITLSRKRARRVGR